jgi:hypothetical protein
MIGADSHSTRFPFGFVTDSLEIRKKGRVFLKAAVTPKISNFRM